jgi:transcriptional regulator with XRE-family HTH domain
LRDSSDDHAAAIAARLGARVRRARHAAGRRQRDVALDAAVSQALISRLELGGGGNIPLETWVRVAEVVGLDWHVVFPTDRQCRHHDVQRRCHRLVAALGAVGGWFAWTLAPEDPGRAETLLEREERREVAIIHVWDVLGNVDAEIQSLDERIQEERETRGAGWTVSGAVVVAWSGANRRRLIESREAVALAFSLRGAEWLAALGRVHVPMPKRLGLIWTDAKLERLRPGVGYIDFRRRLAAGP